MTAFESWRWIFLVLMLCGFQTEASKTSNAVTSPSVPAPKEILRMALFDRPPFGYRENGEIKGFHYEIAKAVAGRTGRDLQISLVPIRRGLELFKRGAVDAMIMTDHAELNELKARRAFLLDVTIFIFTLPSHKPVLSKQDLDSNTGRLAGGCFELSDAPNVKWSDAKSYDQALDMLLLGRVPSVCGTEGLKVVIGARKLDSPKIISYPLIKKGIWFHAQASMPDEKWKQIESAVHALVKEGVIDRLARDLMKTENMPRKR